MGPGLLMSRVELWISIDGSLDTNHVERLFAKPHIIHKSQSLDITSGGFIIGYGQFEDHKSTLGNPREEKMIGNSAMD